MTKEELENEIDEYVRDTCVYYRSTHEDMLPNQFEKYLRKACIHFAIENCIQWHDLRKDPNDLPKDRHNVIVALTNGYSEQDNYYGFRWGCNSNRDVIAWCEIPHFEREVIKSYQKGAESTLRKIIKYFSTIVLDENCGGYFSYLLENEEKLQELAKELENA